ncbi:MAG: hypothetical protein C0518_01060 [Opitutus sp.]|nr:hypothetical protein [Opitutus sp.]
MAISGSNYLDADGTHHEFDSPFDLWPERIASLRSAKQRHCCCRPGEKLRLIVVASEGGEVRPHIRCQDGASAHTVDCVFRRWARFGDGRFPHSIFARGDNSIEAEEGFALWARGRIAESYHACFVMDGMCDVPRFLARLASHPARDFKPRIDPEKLAKEHGFRLVCGFCKPFIAPLRNVAAPSPYWYLGIQEFRHNRLMPGKPVRVLIPTLLRRASAVSVHGALIEGPYAFIGLLDEDSGAVSRFFIQPIAVHSSAVCSVDSGAERSAIEDELAAGVSVYKPLTLAHLNELPFEKRSMRHEELRFRYRPDWLAFREEIEVWELCGFPNDRDYMRLFSKKAEYWRELQRQGHIRFKTAVPRR